MEDGVAVGGGEEPASVADQGQRGLVTLALGELKWAIGRPHQPLPDELHNLYDDPASVEVIDDPQADVADVYGLGSGQSTVTSDGATWSYATGLSGTEGTVESLGGGLYAMNLGVGTGVQMTAAAPVPEPGSLLLLFSGIVGLGAWTRVRKRRRVSRR